MANRSQKPKETIYPDGRITYTLDDGRYHREDGPARIWPDKREKWYMYDELHRIKGPAFITPDRLEWWVDGMVSRLDGPAIIDSTEKIEWWIGMTEFETEDDYISELFLIEISVLLNTIIIRDGSYDNLINL